MEHDVEVLLYLSMCRMSPTMYPLIMDEYGGL